MRRTLAKQLTYASRAYYRSTDYLINPFLPLGPSLCRHFAASAPCSDEGGQNVKHSNEDPEFSCGLKWALAGRGVIVKSKVFYNFKPSELKYNTEQVFGVPLHIRGNASTKSPTISKSQFSKLLKQVSSHLSSVPNMYVQDGTIGPSPKYDCKVRVISDNPYASSSLSNILYKTSARAISHDARPLTIYIASSISSNVREIVGKVLEEGGCSGFAVADIERSSLILCGKVYADFGVVKDGLSALASPVLVARGAVPLSAWLMVCGDWTNLLCGPKDIIKRNGDLHCSLLSSDAGVILSSDECAPFFPRKDCAHLRRKLSSVVILSSDSTGGLQLISKVSPGQAAYHLLAGYNDGKFVPFYNKGISLVEPLALANSIFFKLKEHDIPCFLINTSVAGKLITGEKLMKVVASALANELPSSKSASDTTVEDLKGKYERFLSGKFQKLPEEFAF